MARSDDIFQAKSLREIDPCLIFLKGNSSMNSTVVYLHPSSFPRGPHLKFERVIGTEIICLSLTLFSPWHQDPPPPNTLLFVPAVIFIVYPFVFTAAAPTSVFNKAAQNHHRVALIYPAILLHQKIRNTTKVYIYRNIVSYIVY